MRNRKNDRKAQFPKKLGKKTELLEIVHSDVCVAKRINWKGKILRKFYL